MFSESFFATSAQVLAALLIAFILELGSIIKIIVNRMADHGFTSDTEGSPSRGRILARKETGTYQLGTAAGRFDWRY